MADVIVVGAGPAGSSAAATLARASATSGCHGHAGRRVLLVDRSTFPRDKTCGDAIQGGAIKLLRELGYTGAIDPAKFTKITNWIIEAPSRVSVGSPLHSQHDEPYIARRTEFDTLVFQQALANGAEFCQAQVAAPIIEGGHVVGVTAKPVGAKHTIELRAPIVIAADGATSVIGRALLGSREEERHWAVAIRCYARMKAKVDNRCEFYFPRVVLPGYAWVFPMGEDTANIGVGIRLDQYRKRGQTLAVLLDRFLDVLGDRVDRSSVEGIKSWQLPFGSKPMSRVFDGCMLVGDAGHFVDPLLGAGIYYGMLTGHLAAQVADGALRDGDTSRRRLLEFDRLWKQHLAGKLRHATRVQRLVIAQPWTLNLLMSVATHNRALGRLVVMGLSGEKL